jgi:beta-N-acetylhexosaminidase
MKILTHGLASKIALFILLPYIVFSGLSPCEASAADDSLDIEIGQMIMVGFRGLRITDRDFIIKDIRERYIGGVILFDYDVPTRSLSRNIESPEQLRSLTAALQKASLSPLFIAVDQEGGQVSRLKEKAGFPATVSQEYLGELNDPRTTLRQAESIASALSAGGINLNFAPVVDLNINPDNPIIGKLKRSFSARPDIVTRHALIVIESHHEKGILTAIKHFPGQGSARSDSHKGLVDVTDHWSAIELEPFSAVIRSGKCDMVMTAHLFNRKLDPDRPATLSAATLAGILRGQLDFDGVVISDDMQMKAVTSFYGLETAIKAAILAGVDVLMFANNSVYEEDIAARAISIIKELVKTGVIKPERIDASYRRILKLKERLKK